MRGDLRACTLLETPYFMSASPFTAPCGGTRGAEEQVGTRSRRPSKCLADNAEVLCVDDDAVQRLVYMRTLTKAGMRCTVAASAEEALDLLAKRWSRTGDDTEFPQQIILDLCLPGMSGPEALAVIRERYPDSALPVSLCSAAHEELLRITDDDDAAFALLKPFTPSHLLACVKTQAKLAQLQSERRTLVRTLSSRLQLDSPAANAPRRGLLRGGRALLRLALWGPRLALRLLPVGRVWRLRAAGAREQQDGREAGPGPGSQAELERNASEPGEFL